MIDWTDLKCPVSRHFTVKEALWLPRWGRSAAAGDGLTADAEEALERMFGVMDVIRDFIGLPIIVHCAYRPARYNQEVGGAPGSSHMARIESGVRIAAVDWHANVDGAESVGQSCDILRAALLPKLADWGLRMENNGIKSPWVHLDTHPVVTSRYFKP